LPKEKLLKSLPEKPPKLNSLRLLNPFKLFSRCSPFSLCQRLLPTNEAV